MRACKHNVCISEFCGVTVDVFFCIEEQAEMTIYVVQVSTEDFTSSGTENLQVVPVWSQTLSLTVILFAWDIILLFRF